MTEPKTAQLPERLLLQAGQVEPGALPEPYPFETIAPVREGHVTRDGVSTWYAQFGDNGPWIAFAPIYQIAHTHTLKGVVPYLAQHFRVVITDLRGNGKSDRPNHQSAYTFDEYFADFVAVLDRLEVQRAAVIGVSATAMTALRLAAEQPGRVSHLVIAGGFAERRMDDPLDHYAAKIELAEAALKGAGLAWNELDTSTVDAGVTEHRRCHVVHVIEPRRLNASWLTVRNWS
jgi:pimeloyl-ACP methyl ester carboxylesterase